MTESVLIFLGTVVVAILGIAMYGKIRYGRDGMVSEGRAPDLETENSDGPAYHRRHAFRSYIVQHEAPGYTGRVRIWRQLPDRDALELSIITDNPEAELQQFFRIRMEDAQAEILGRDFTPIEQVHRNPRAAVASEVEQERQFLASLRNMPPMPKVKPAREEQVPQSVPARGRRMVYRRG